MRLYRRGPKGKNSPTLSPPPHPPVHQMPPSSASWSPPPPREAQQEVSIPFAPVACLRRGMPDPRGSGPAGE